MLEPCGNICAVITYLTVLTVGVGFVRIGIWEALLDGEPHAYI